CECGTERYSGIPCEHVMAYCEAQNTDWSWKSRILDCLTTEAYIQCYSGEIPQVDSTQLDIEDVNLCDPVDQRGRPKIRKRVRVRLSKQHRLCSLCLGAHHTKRNCPERHSLQS